jgi:hypothetical protein
MQGVVRHADFSGSSWTTRHRGIIGDARASSANNLTAEFLGDYNFVVATNGYAVAVWNDVRDAAVCGAVNTWRQSLVDGTQIVTPAPGTNCPAEFGNTDIFGVFLP